MDAIASYPSLKGRAVFVTGGATGIGAAFVERFCEQGCRVAFVDVQADKGHELAARLAPSASFTQCDVTDPVALTAAIRVSAAAFGPITVLINNVADDTREIAADITIAEWRKGLAVNLDPVMVAAQAVYPMMKAAGGGSIVNLSSINTVLAPAELPTYVAAKGAVNALTMSLARAWGPDRVRVNALSPGWTITPRQLERWLTPEAEAEWTRQVALPDRLWPDDIARAALFLASAESRMVTGQILHVDAGRT